MRGKVFLALIAATGLLRFTVAAAADPPAGEKLGGRWAILIGVDNYTELGKLRYAGNDQRALSEQLVASGFPKDQVFLLHDKAAEPKYLPFQANIERQLDLVLGLAREGDLMIVGFSGHGVQLEGKSYFCPMDARLDKLSSTTIALDGVYDRLSKCKATLRLLLVDACRNDLVPVGRRSVAISRSLNEFGGASEKPPEGILFLASCGPGQVSMEDEQFSHGVFMHFLLEGLQGKAANAAGTISLAGLYDYVSLETKKYVVRKFNEFQTPALKGEITGPFEICSLSSNRPTPVSSMVSPREITASFTVRLEENGPPAEGAQVELVYTGPASTSALTLGRATANAKGVATIITALTVAQQHAGTFEAVASLAGASKGWSLPDFPHDLRYEVWIPRLLEKSITNSIGMKLVWIPAGEFMMGNAHTAVDDVALCKKYDISLTADAFEDEYPRHRVRITKAFYLGATNVTRGQFRRFVEDTGYKTDAEGGDNPGAFGWDSNKKQFVFSKTYSWQKVGFEQTEEHPVVGVSWNDAVAFCEWLSRKEGKTYRLPTEAEWEYACRAGTTTRYWCGDDPEGLAEVANVADAAAKAQFPDWKTIAASDGYVFTAPVGSFRPNAFGLYDMHGNTWQWCADWYHSRYYDMSPVDDPRGPASGSGRVARGGSWGNGAGICRSAYRHGFGPGDRDGILGFRISLIQTDK
jgi:formylglycine-generating enzyme required for sulfatase activity